MNDMVKELKYLPLSFSLQAVVSEWLWRHSMFSPSSSMAVKLSYPGQS